MRKYKTFYMEYTIYDECNILYIISSFRKISDPVVWSGRVKEVCF